ncbi:hypothetical protein CRENBAI_019504 [Crenichthys baileyi]|uniref:Uncharacterized protein n=1 Tax=Crenichthys baileyi TaxID=28760 RepID=A0AAV9QWK9_9TELE
MEDRIKEEIQYTIRTLEESAGGTLSPQVMFHNAASNIICQVLFGARFEYNDELIKVIVQCFNENAKLANGPWCTTLFPKLEVCHCHSEVPLKIMSGSRGSWCLSPAVYGREAGYTLDRSPVHRKGQ